MMELALIRTLLDRDFYEQHKGIRCPDKIFSKDVRKIKQSLDSAMQTYEGSMNVQDLQAVFNRMNQSMTTATRTAYDALFRRIEIAEPIKEEIAQDTLSHLFQQHVGDVVANQLLEDYKNDFTPNLRVDWEDDDLDTILAATALESRWSFNIPSLTRRIEGVSGGHLVVVGARPNTGKTSFHASIIAADGGFAHQGARCIVLCNEEAYTRVASRYVSDITLKAAAIHARNIAKQYDCCVIWMSQLSAEAEGKADLNQSMMEGSKTGKAAEADLMVLIGKTMQVEGEEEDPVRYLNLAKNKLNGYQGKITCVLDGSRSIYTA